MSGAVFAVGGGESHEDHTVVLETFLALCGAHDAALAVVGGASEQSAASYARYRATFMRLGARDVHWADDPAEGVRRPDWWPDVSGIFFAGGDQARLVAGIGTLLQRIRESFLAGVSVGGSSAGAAALSETMLAGGSARSPLNPGHLQFSEGLGFWPETIVDQHFSERRRLPRLLAAIVAHPARVGVGIDENTAVHWNGATGRVVGSGTVTVLDARGSCHIPGRSPLRLDVLRAGEQFRLDAREKAS